MTRDLGRVGASVGLDDLTDEAAAELEAAGYGTLWVGPAVAPDLIAVERVLAATESVVVATAITTIWSATPAELASAYHRVADRFGDRLLLGLGTAHPGINAPLGHKPLQAMTEMLDGLDAADVPVERRLIGALGPRMTQLAGDRTRGTHPYLTPPSATAEARRELGPAPLIAPVVLVADTDDETDALAIGRDALALYLTLDNYRRNFLRAGFTHDDLDHGGSERLIRALVTSAPHAREAIAAQDDAGADHVAIGIKTGDGRPTVGAYTRVVATL